MAHSAHRDRGGHILDYAVVFALVATVAAVVNAAMPGIGSTISSNVASAICATLGGEVGQDGEDCALGDVREPGPTVADAPQESPSADATQAPGPTFAYPPPDIDAYGAGDSEAASSCDDVSGGASGGDDSGDDASGGGGPQTGGGDQLTPPTSPQDPVLGPVIGEEGVIEPLEAPSWLGDPNGRTRTSTERSTCIPDNYVERMPMQCSLAPSPLSPRLETRLPWNTTLRTEVGVVSTNVDLELLQDPSLAAHEDYATGEEGVFEEVTYGQWSESTRAAVAGVTAEVPIRRGLDASFSHEESNGEGERTYTEVTVSESYFEAIEDGQVDAPNPFDPLSIPVHGSVFVEEEEFTQESSDTEVGIMGGTQGGEDDGADVSAGASVHGYFSLAEGESLSSDVYRISEDHVQVTVGESDTMRANQELGLGAEARVSDGENLNVGAHGDIAVQNVEMVNDGELYSVVLDITTEEGWNAYQDFITQGELPADDNPGAEESYDTTILSSFARSRFAAGGGLTLEGALPSGHALSMTEELGFSWDRWQNEYALTERERDDGTLLVTERASQEDMTYESSAIIAPNGDVCETEHRFLLQDVPPEKAEALVWIMDGEDAEFDGDTHVDLRFTGEEIMELNDLAIAYAAELNDMSEDEVRAHMDSVRAEDGRRPYESAMDELDWHPHAAGPEGDIAFRLGWAENPAEVMMALLSRDITYESGPIVEDWEHAILNLHDHGPEGDPSEGALLEGDLEVVEP